MIKFRTIIAWFFILLAVFSCKKESFITSSDAILSTSADSIKFDTVFTSTGSITQSFKIFNNNNQKLLLSKIKLAGGSGSAFKININGVASTEQDNLEIDANDSIYIFIALTVNPTTANLPFIISDSILINYNGNDRYVQLQAYGQNAHFLSNQFISINTTWQNDLPYVILGGLQVDSGVVLNINAGCRIYCHANAAFIVDGTLHISAGKGSEVQFTGDRLDKPYSNFPGGWPGIVFGASSKDNELSFVNIKNAYQAVAITGPATNGNPKLILHQCIIDNAFNTGLLSSNSSVQADNTLISNCANNISIRQGGDYIFTNCTVASFSNTYFLHKTPVLSIANFTEQNGATITADLNAVFRNNIFWGDNGTVDDEIVTDKQGINIYNVVFENCLYKAVNDPANSILTAVIVNQDPSFDSIDVNHQYYDFRVTKNPAAPGIDQGVSTAFLKDLDDNNRANGFPDLGCYEKQ